MKLQILLIVVLQTLAPQIKSHLSADSQVQVEGGPMIWPAEGSRLQELQG
jgi:hypothetical protein